MPQEAKPNYAMGTEALELTCSYYNEGKVYELIDNYGKDFIDEMDDVLYRDCDPQWVEDVEMSFKHWRNMVDGVTPYYMITRPIWWRLHKFV